MNKFCEQKLNLIKNKWHERNRDKKVDFLFLPKVEEVEKEKYFVYPVIYINDKNKCEVIDWIYQEISTLKLKFSLDNSDNFLGEIDINKNVWNIFNINNFNTVNSFVKLYKYIYSNLKKGTEDKIIVEEYLKVYDKYFKANTDKNIFKIYFLSEKEKILKKISSLKNLEQINYDFEWTLENGLRFLSYEFIELCLTLLERGEISLKEITNGNERKIEVQNNFETMCFDEYSYDQINELNQKIGKELNDVTMKEIIKDDVWYVDKHSFVSGVNQYEDNVCRNCVFSKCPKYYAGYILYLKNKGLLERILNDREEYRKNNFKSNYFTFEWNVEDGVRNIPEMTFNFAMKLVNNNLVWVEQKLNEKNSIIIDLPFEACYEYKFYVSDNNAIKKINDKFNGKWNFATRNTNKLLYRCISWDCAVPYCIYDVAGYLFYLKKSGRWEQVKKDRKYYLEHKEEIEEQSIKSQKEQLIKLEEDAKKKRSAEIERILNNKNKPQNVEQLIDKITTETGLHVTIEGESGNEKKDLIDKIGKLLKSYYKIDNESPDYISLHNLSSKKTYEEREDSRTTAWTIKEASISDKHLYVLTDIKEFINEYNKSLNSDDLIKSKRFTRVIELITSLFNEDYIILTADKKTIDEFLSLDQRLKFVFQNNRFEISNLSIDDLFELYYKNLNNTLITKLRNNEALREKVKDDFIEYVSINAEYFPFHNEELAKYLANFSIGKKDFIFPDNIYKKESVEGSLKNIVGLSSVKENIKKFEKYALYTVKAKNLGIRMNKSNFHMIFTGNPGTGKTLIARIMAKMLYDLGLISENKLIEVERKDLVASYVGQTSQKTSEIIEKAMGGVLFIDEAYALVQGKKDDGDYGIEAIATLIKAMEDYKENLVVIFAGYKDEMKSFLDINPGIASRIGYTFHFEDYTNVELQEIFVKKMNNMGYEINPQISKKTLKIFEYYSKRKNFGNGRFVDKFIQEVIMKHALRDVKNIKKISLEDIPTIEELNNNNYNNIDSNEMLENLVGLKEIKNKVKEFEKYIKFQKKADEQNINIPLQNLHMVFTGNSGTGKTTVARIIAKILFDLGIIHENKIVEVERKDLVAGYVGQTANKTFEIIEKAMGGVLFIDEAYTLVPSIKGENDYGTEVISTLLKAMEDHKGEFIVIFAGYRNEMIDFINSNSGISSRIGYFFDFPDYTEEEYCEIYYKKITELGFVVEKDAKKEIEKIMKYFCTVENNGNGRFVDKVIQNTLIKMSNKESNISIISKKYIPTIQEMSKTMYNGDQMINPDLITENDLRTTAIHEVGHATIRYLLNKTPGIKKISINADGSGTLGYVEYNTKSGRYTMSKSEYLNRICGVLGGLCNEEVYNGEHENGVNSDLNTASKFVRDMISRYGMSNLGLYTFPYENNIDKYIYIEANKILSECYEKTLKLLKENKAKTEKVIEYLLKNKEINEKEFIEVFNSDFGKAVEK